MAIRGRAGGISWTRESQLQWSQRVARSAGEPFPVQLDSPPASTDGTRGPLTVGRRERSPQHFLSVFVAASLLTTTLATVVSAPPVGEALAFSAPSRPKVVNVDTSASSFALRASPAASTDVARRPIQFEARRPAQVVDTTPRGQPLTLRGVAVQALPVGKAAPAIALAPVHALPGTTAGMPLTLRAAVVQALPPGEASHVGTPAAWRIQSDTTEGQPLTLLTPPASALPPGRGLFVAPSQRPHQRATLAWRPEGAPAVDTGPLPIGAQSSMAPPKLKWLPAEESAGTPKTLYIDDTYASTTLTESAPSLRRPGADTSQGAWALTHPAAAVPLPPGEAVHVASLPRPWIVVAASQSSWILRIPAQAAPPGEAAYAAPPRALWQVVDTSQGLPCVLQLAAQALPPGEASYVAPPDQRRAVVDTTRGQPAPLQFIQVPLPVGQAAHVATPDARRAVVDTTQRTPKALTQDAQAPVGEASYVSTPRELRIFSETSASTPVAITGAPVPPPIVNLQQTAPDRVRRVTDTTQSAWAVTHPLPPLPPGKVSFVGAPRWVWLNGSTTYESPQVAIQAVPVAGTFGPAGYGYQRPRIHVHRPASPDSARPGSPNTRRGRQ